jgi:PAS domain S-box-containing protein
MSEDQRMSLPRVNDKAGARTPAELASLLRLTKPSIDPIAISDLQPILYEVLDAIMELQGADFGNVQLYDEATASLKIVAHRGLDQSFLDYFAVVDASDTSACGRALCSGARIVIEDVNNDPDFAPHRATAASSGFRAIQSTPLLDRVSGKPVGMLSTHFREPRCPSEQELRLTDTFGRLAANCIASRLAERRLRESEAQLAAILNQFPGAVGLTDLEGKFLLRGGPLSALLGDDMPSRIPEPLRPWRGFDANGRPLPASEYPGPRALRGETVIPGVDFVHIGDGGWDRWFRVSAAPFCNAAGEAIGVVGILQDIDETKRAELRLRESDARLQAAVDLAKLGRCEWNLQTGEIEWDDLLHAMWGLPAGAPVDYGTWRAGVHPDDLERVLAAVRRRADPREDGLYAIEYRVIGKDGVERWIATRGRMTFQDDKPISYQGVALDVTERKRAEQQNLLLIAELHHRTRNLLAVVNSISTETLAASNSLADFSATFGNRLASLSRVQDLLSRGDATPVTISELVRLELQALGAEPDGQRVTVEGPEVTLPNRLVQILALALHELATNARKHGALAAPEGRLAVSWRTINHNAERSLAIEWREYSGIPGGGYVPSVRKGFGRSLIEEALPYQLDAQTRLEIGPDGVFCSVTISLDSEQTGAGP